MTSLGKCEPENIQPESVEYLSSDGLLAKTMHIKHQDVLVPQHSHQHDHLTVLAAGRIRAWCDGELLGDFSAPHSFTILAGTKHMFLSLVPDTMLICLHNISRTGEIEIREEHQFDYGAHVKTTTRASV